MRIEEVRAVLRPRSTWQTIDLGCLLWQRQLSSILLAWATAAVPLAGIALFATGGPNLVSALLFWWFFPVASRGVLFVLSRGLFGDELKGWSAMRAAWGFGARGLLRAVTFDRLYPMRTLRSPVSLLEGLRGKQRRKRERLIERYAGHMVGIAASTVAFVGLGVFSLLVGVQFLHAGPLPSEVDLSSFDEPWLVFGAWFLSVSCFEPLFVAIGFANYIDGRATVEGWDVELGLRLLAKRIESAVRAVVAPVAVLALVAVGFVGGQGEGDVAPSEELTPEAAIERVLADPEFGGRELEWTLRLKGRLEPNELSTEPWWAPVAAVVGRVLFVVFVGLLAVVVGWLALQMYRSLVGGSGAKVRVTTSPRSIVEEALEGGEDSLPADVGTAVRALFAAGRPIEAAGLLYRASLVRLVETHRVAIDVADTESACLRRAQRQLAAPLADAFRRVTHLWQSGAYAALVVQREQLEAAIAAYHQLEAGA